MLLSPTEYLRYSVLYGASVFIIYLVVRNGQVVMGPKRYQNASDIYLKTLAIMISLVELDNAQTNKLGCLNNIRLINQIPILITFFILSKEYAANYWAQKGAPKSKINIGMPLYGHSFTLKDASHDHINDPMRAAGNAGQYTRQAGILAYYEVKY